MGCGAGIGAQIYQSLDPSTAFWCLCFHISVKPLWESRLHQLCLGQPSKMGWVHALARVLENLTDGGWLGSRGEGREGRWKWQQDTLSPSRKGFPTLNLENDEFYGSPRVDKLMPEARIRSPFFRRLSPMISSKHGNIQQRKGSPEAGCQDWFGQKQTFWLRVNHCPSVFSLIISRMRGLGCKFSDITILGFPHL